jgi:hypothetical protein
MVFPPPHRGAGAPKDSDPTSNTGPYPTGHSERAQTGGPLTVTTLCWPTDPTAVYYQPSRTTYEYLGEALRIFEEVESISGQDNVANATIPSSRKDKSPTASNQ